AARRSRECARVAANAARAVSQRPLRKRRHRAARSMIRWLLPAAAALLLSACANLPVGSDGLSLERRAAELGAVTDWEMRGRLAVDTGERAFQGSFNWRQQADALDLNVRGPLGAGVLHVAGTPATLE